MKTESVNTELKINLAKAVINVMKSIKGIDKNMQIGTGNNSYKGIADKDVKQEIGRLMVENGLCILPIDIESKVQIDRWEETSQQYGTKTKQSVFAEVITKYLLLHESGESVVLCGSGHGIDSQDKAAGKATTYALKYTLLYTFMVATGKIDDTDNEHSDTKEIPQPTRLPSLKPKTTQWTQAVDYLSKDGVMSAIKKKYYVSPEFEQTLMDESLLLITPTT